MKCFLQPFFLIINDSHPLHFHPISLNQMTIAEIIRCTGSISLLFKWKTSSMLARNVHKRKWKRMQSTVSHFGICQNGSEIICHSSRELLLCLEGMNNEISSPREYSRVNDRKSILRIPRCRNSSYIMMMTQISPLLTPVLLAVIGENRNQIVLSSYQRL